MNKTEFVDALCAASELTKPQALSVLNAFISVISETLAKGDKVSLIGFGTFEARSRPARTARNPRTGESIKIKASRLPAFKAGKALKEAL